MMTNYFPNKIIDCICLFQVYIQIKFNSLMRSFYGERSKQKSGQKVNKKKSVHFTFNKIEEVKQQLLKLKQMHYQLVKYVRQFINQLPKQLQTCYSTLILKKVSIGRAQTYRQKLKSIQKLKVNTEVLKNQSRSYESKLKKQDHQIKHTILESLESLKQLQNKENCLREVNEKHKSLRKSLSKEKNISNKLSSLQTTPSYSQKLENGTISQKIVPFSLHKKQISPLIFKKQEDKFFDISFQQSCDKQSIFNKQIPAQNRFTVLKCESGHQYYTGDTVNQIPHGNGKFKLCCHKMPLKISSSKIVKYEGGFMNGKFDGKGTLICKGDVRFEGHFSKGMRHGVGIIYLQGLGERGRWQNDQLITFL